MSDITELDETAQRLKVSWRKANNYYASFASQLLEIRRQIESGAYGSEWTFSGWLLKKAGLFESQVMMQLKVFSRVIAAEEREKIDQANIQIAAQKRAQKRLAAAAVAERRQERAIVKAHKERERETLRVEKENRKQARAKEAKQAAKKTAKKIADRRHYEKKKITAALGSNDRLQQLVAQIVIGRTKVERSRKDWIDGTMEIAVALAEARQQFPSNDGFSCWLISNNIDFKHNERAALINMGTESEISRMILGRTERHSYQLIWLKEIKPALESDHVTSARKAQIVEEIVEAPAQSEIIH